MKALDYLVLLVLIALGVAAGTLIAAKVIQEKVSADAGGSSTGRLLGALVGGG